MIRQKTILTFLIILACAYSKTLTYLSNNNIDLSPDDLIILSENSEGKNKFAPACNCQRNGECYKNKTSNEIQCFCNSGYTVYEAGSFPRSKTCKECNCGYIIQEDGNKQLFNCTVKSGTVGGKVTCLCPPGYFEDGGSKCLECNCGYRIQKGDKKQFFNCTLETNPFVRGLADIRCICNVPGYFNDGSKCSEINPCKPNPCMNKGICNKINATKYQCACNSNYIGVNCEIALNSCRAKPCKNGGTCQTINGTSFTCQCPNRHTGKLCETELFTTVDTLTAANDSVTTLEMKNSTEVDSTNETEKGDFTELTPTATSVIPLTIEPVTSSPLRNIFLRIINFKETEFVEKTFEVEEKNNSLNLVKLRRWDMEFLEFKPKNVNTIN